MAGYRKTRQRIEPRFDDGARRMPTESLSEQRSAIAATRLRKKPDTAGNRRTKVSGKSSKVDRRRFGALRKLAYWTFVVGLWGGIAVAILVAYYAMQLPHASTWAIPQRPPNVKVVSVDGRLLANRGVSGGEAMRLEEMSPYIPMAVIAIEDRRFKSHFGIDPLGIARAMMTNLVSGRLVQGGSTLTQQLAKNLFLEPRRDLERKVQEAILAIWLEHKYTKDEILELYLNRVYFGSGAYGVDAASRRYFSKSARDVNLSEAALLAGLLKAPSRLSPAKDKEAAEERAQVVLASMRQAGFVTDSEVAAALTMEANKAKRYWSGSEHYVADMVMKELAGIIDPVEGDVLVDTTIDLGLQKNAGGLIREAIAENGSILNVSQGALVSMDGTGAIRALVGGVEYADSQFNRAVDAKRQPGSAFKPIVYLAAIEAGATPETVRVDRPVKIGNWTPENYDRKYRGPVTLSEALSQSLNTIAVQMVSETGPKAVADMAARLGIHTKMAKNASIALGTSEVSLLELTSAYAAFSNGGYLAEPFLIKRVTDMDGKVLYERNAVSPAKILDSREVGMMNEMLRRTVEEGTGKAAKFGDWQIAGKTGTTQNFKDALFIGYTANLVTGVWFGNDDGAPTKKITGGGLPAKTFANFMAKAHKGVPVSDLPGAYLPQTVEVVPTPRPQSGIQPVSVLETATPELLRKPLSQVNAIENTVDGSPRPGADVGVPSANQKPKSILDLLLGR
jgi:penicillin-binding protein 1A